MAYIGQREDEWEAEQKKKERARKRAAQTVCPTCGKRVLGIKDHLRDVHNQKIVHPKPQTIQVEEIT